MPSSVSAVNGTPVLEWQFFCFHEVPAFVQSSSYRVRLLPTASGFVSQQLPAAPQRWRGTPSGWRVRRP